jgi:hypothetical protein
MILTFLLFVNSCQLRYLAKQTNEILMTDAENRSQIIPTVSVDEPFPNLPDCDSDCDDNEAIACDENENENIDNEELEILFHEKQEYDGGSLSLFDDPFFTRRESIDSPPNDPEKSSHSHEYTMSKWSTYTHKVPDRYTNENNKKVRLETHSELMMTDSDDDL